MFGESVGSSRDVFGLVVPVSRLVAKVVASTVGFAVATVVFLGAVVVVDSVPLPEVSAVAVGAVELVIEVRFGVDFGLATAMDVLKSCDVCEVGAGEVILIWVVFGSADVFGKIVVAFWFVFADDVLSCVVVPNNKKYAIKNKSVI